MKAFFCLLAVAVLALPVLAQQSFSGRWVLADDGRQFAVYDSGPHAGFYWLNNGNDAYTRQAVTVAAHYVGGRYCAPATTYQYAFSHRYQAPAAYVPPRLPPLDSPTFDVEIVKLAAARDRAILTERLTILKQQGNANLVKLLGMEGNFRINGYGQNVGYGTLPPNGYNGNLQLSSAGAQGTSVYGYQQTYNNRAEVYGQIDGNELLRQFGRSVEKVNDNGASLLAQFGQTANDAGVRQQLITEQQAKIQSVVQLLNALERKGAVITQKGTITQSGTGTQPLPNPQPQAQGPPLNESDSLKAWQATATAKCASCHFAGANRVEGGFDITQYPSFSVEQKLRVITRLLTTDESKRMPRGHPPLTVDEVQLWLAN